MTNRKETHFAVFFAIAALFFPGSSLASSLATSERTVFLSMESPIGPHSTDFDFLCLIPAATVINHGTPSVLAIHSKNDLDSNIYLQNYLARYQPNQAYTIHFTATIPHATTSTRIDANSRIALSDTIALKFWKSAEKIVAVTDSSYSDALQGSALAADLKVPLVYFTSTQSIDSLVAKLSAKEVIYIGSASKSFSVNTTQLKSPEDVYKYLKSQNIICNYFAATNAADLSLTDGPKQSLIAPLIAARRNGIVVPLQNTSNSNDAVLELKTLYSSIKAYPQYLALIGSSKAIPSCFIPGYTIMSGTDVENDFKYSNVDSDSFPDIAVGRIETYDIFDASIYASRVSTYDNLVDQNWDKKFIEAGSFNGVDVKDLLENYGFKETHNYLGQDISDATPFESSLILHFDHSSDQLLGSSLTAWSKNILAPAVVIASGCSPAGIDMNDTNNTKQLFKLGAVALLGAARTSFPSGQIYRNLMVNKLLEGASVGEAFQSALQTVAVIFLNYKQTPPVDNLFRQTLYNQTLAGDPALVLNIPQPPKIKPASSSIHLDTLTLSIPDTIFSEALTSGYIAEVGWSGGPLYSPASPGVIAIPYRIWDRSRTEMKDSFDLVYLASITTSNPQTTIVPLDNFPAPFQFNYSYFVDSLPNGKYNILWLVQIARFNPETGEITDKIDSFKFKIIQPTSAVAKAQYSRPLPGLDNLNGLVFDLRGRRINLKQFPGKHTPGRSNGLLVGETKNGQAIPTLQMR